MQTEVKDVKKEELVQALFKIGAHFGYSRSSRHSSTKPFIFGFKNKTAIIDLERTIEMLEVAKEFVFELGRSKKNLLLIGTKGEAKKIIKSLAESAGLPFVTERWIGGTLTNFKEIKKRVERMEDLREKNEKGELSIYTKKERGVIAKELRDLERYFDGIVGLNKFPGAVFVIDANYEEIAVAEAKKIKIPVISLCNSDCNISQIEYPIVANDSAISSISYFTKQIVEAYKKGLATAPEESKKEEKKENEKDKIDDKKPE
ncbi:MAG: 30S ribosomal protein S2 [Candidatus Paceibacterota bacterium]